MLFCCLRRNLEVSCHKHVVVVSREKQRRPLNLPATSVINLLRSVAVERIALHLAVKPFTTRDAARYWLRIAILPTPPAFNPLPR